MKGALSKYVGFGMLALAAAAMPALGQVGGGGGAGGGGGGGGGFGGGRGGGGRGGRGNPAQFQQQRMDQIKQEIGAKDDEWVAIQAALEKVMAAQRDVQTGGGMRGMGGRRGGGAAAQPNPNASDVQQKTQALQAALQNPDTPPEQIKEKLQALRDARAKAQDVLKKDQADLQSLLTQRQEAIFVELGFLE